MDICDVPQLTATVGRRWSSSRMVWGARESR